ncbi:membrane bound O-acyl transferase family-domain-containing protein [Talaromyces proteolyticus]|uniref:Membrane bound O-acyl transferase family-domain-containing protein n=1 Tax=Talaromyces proteolyticus TaxID=1131652 RepID=A0AAD4Q4C8_9EURO|nr:membrane bound O-acyl transferase family-domain-containing protein [Talaromyces proteolyticus]KAH8702532.1 membrane bound O-acyl transferase family-domain-containing protein [Talaromyces proteolyticus]
MAEVPLQSHLDFIKQREEKFKLLLHQGAFSPFLLQHAFGILLLPVIPLVIRSTSTFQSKLIRYGFHAIITCFSLYTILYVRFIGPGNGYGLGLMTIWLYIWSLTTLIFNDVQRDFRRIEKEYVDLKMVPLHGSPRVVGLSEFHYTADHSPRSHKANNMSRCKIYRWQSFPDSLPHRVEWVLDLIFNLRGPNWNWCIRSLLPFPADVIKDIGEHGSSPHKKTSKPIIEESSAKLRHTAFSFLRTYVALDFLKVVMMRDPYFWGFVDNPLPAPWPFSILAFSSALIRIYRLLISMMGAFFALKYIVSLGSLFFLGLSLAFPRFSRTITHQPLDEAWLYPPAFGPAISALDYGLIGAWNIWWHQLFRFGFSESARFFSNLILPNPPKKRLPSYYSIARRLIQVMVAFSMSGLVHAMGSYTAFADTKPFNAFLFFVLQGIGVLVQGLLAYCLSPLIRQIRPSRLLIRITNLNILIVWFYYTAPLLADDFSRCGLWMLEPIPISPVRGALGWGIEEEGWFCWRGSWFEWWSGETWWQSGIRFT